MNPVQRPDSFEAADYFSWLGRRWWIVLVLAIIGLVLAFGYVTVTPKSYSATAGVTVTPIAGTSNNDVAGSRTGTGQVNLDTEAQIVTSQAVAAKAGALMHSSDTPFQLAKNVAVTVPPNSSILDITCGWSTAAGSAECAQDFATAYLSNRSAMAASGLNKQLTSIQNEITAKQSSEAKLQAAMVGLPKNSPTFQNDTELLKNDARTINSLSGQVGGLEADLADTSGGSIITPAAVPSAPSSPQKMLILPSGLVGGLVLGLAIGFLVDRRDKRIHGPSDVDRLVDAPVLLSLPQGAFGRDITLASPRSKVGHEFTELAHTVSAALGEGNHVILVAGTGSGAGRSVIAANLAATLARTHTEVVLVCAALNGTVAPELLGVGEPGAGLAELVTGSATVRDVVRAPAGMPGLWVVTPGADPSLAVYLRHDTSRELISRLRRDVRYVVIEAQATEEGADTFALGEFADAALVTVEVGRTVKPTVTDCVRRLRRLRTPVLGTVVFGPLPGRISVRPPRERHTRMGVEAPMRDGVSPSGRNYGELSGMQGMPDRRYPAAAPRDMYGDPADRVAGS